MSDITALLFVLVASPLSALVGYFLLFRPYEMFGLTARFSRWSLRISGLRVDAPPLKWFYSPLHRRFFGDPATLVDRMCDNPSQFRIVGVLLRAQGVFLLVWSVVAAWAGAIAFVQD